jgi:hypothetical protein
MSRDSQSELIEGQAYRYFGDGLLDIVVGLTLLSAGIAMMLDLAALIGVWVAPLWLIMLSAKKRITVPRMSRSNATLSEPRMLRLLTASVALGLGLLLALGLIVFSLSGALPELRVWFRSFGGPLLGLLGAMGLAVAGWATDARRFYLYAALLVVAAASNYLISLPFPIYLALVGAAILVTGLVALIRSMHEF